jgi:riboflavin kinase / FMN adenylyltransferase
MEIHFQLEQLPLFKNPVLTIGAFDGVHSGHLAILDELKQVADQIQGETVVITFHPHPRRILNNADAPALLTSLSERIERFEHLGIHHLVVVPFDPAFAEMSATDYINKFLIDLFHPKVIIIGNDHRFGKDRSGDLSMLKDFGVSGGFTVKEIPEKLLNESRVSSTNIRHALLNGDIKLANQLLTYNYQLIGTVVVGDRLGRTLGFPTANLSMLDSDKLIPASGVYAVHVLLLKGGQKRAYKGMMNIGYRPTVNGKERRIEVHIFKFDEDIYNEILVVSLVAHTRKELKFAGLEALKTQLHKDKEEINALLES